MFEGAFFSLLFLAFTGFMVNRLHAGLTRGEIMVKGRTYSRPTTPIAYWTVMSMAGAGVALGLLMSLVSIAVTLRGFTAG